MPMLFATIPISNSVAVIKILTMLRSDKSDILGRLLRTEIS